MTMAPRSLSPALPCLAMLLALSGTDAVAQEGRAIFQSWIGRTLVVEVPNGNRNTAAFAADGTARIDGGAADTGKWRLDDDGYCVTWQKLRGGREACFTIVRMGNEFLIVFKNTTDVAGKVTGFR